MVLLSIFILSLSSSFGSNFDFKHIPVQEEGRIKPMDSFARNQMLRFYGKRALKSEKVDAVDWLFDIATDNEKALTYKVFNVRNPEVVRSLGLEWSSEHKYTFEELSIAVQSHLELLNDIHSKPEETLTLVEKQLLELYFNILRFKDITSSFSCLLPYIHVHDETIANAIEIEPGSSTNYYRFITHFDKVNKLISTLRETPENEWTATDSSLSILLQRLNYINADRFSQSVKLIPEMTLTDTEEWLSLWELMDGRMLSDSQKKLIESLEQYISARLDNNTLAMQLALNNYQSAIVDLPHAIPEKEILQKEVWNNEANLFYNSLAFYLLAFIILAISWLTKPVLLRKIAFGSLVIGLLLQTYGLYLRMIIMGRPPVSTLYETIVFVGFIGVICAVMIEYYRKDGLGIFVGVVVGSIFHYVSFGYAADGDTLGMLVAVLDSNFWLATHVTTITIGYGASIVAGLMGHIYLVLAIAKSENTTKLKEIYNNTFGITILALFFTLFGTILGGIWADQSWGRFWGWDPKENGALLICMWQLLMIHMRLTGLVRAPGFALGMVLNNIVVVIAWFGVNLLNVGLHSYGFASGVAMNLTIFITFEIVTGFATYYWAKSKLRF